jgi:hypothetical protein
LLSLVLMPALPIFLQVGPGAVRPQAMHRHPAVAAGPCARAATGAGGWLGPGQWGRWGCSACWPARKCTASLINFSHLSEISL